jgi:hypothetical protein
MWMVPRDTRRKILPVPMISLTCIWHGSRQCHHPDPAIEWIKLQAALAKCQIGVFVNLTLVLDTFNPENPSVYGSGDHFLTPRRNLQRLDDDIAILTKYLKTEGAPKAAISILEGMSTEQQESWKKAVERIEKLLEE